MTIGTTFWCDHGDRNGNCPQQISFATIDLARAEALAIRAGWDLDTGKVLCALYHAPKRDKPKERRSR